MRREALVDVDRADVVVEEALEGAFAAGDAVAVGLEIAVATEGHRGVALDLHRGEVVVAVEQQEVGAFKPELAQSASPVKLWPSKRQTWPGPPSPQPGIGT